MSTDKVLILTSDSIDAYLGWRSSMGASTHSIRAYRNDLTGLLGWIEPSNALVAGLDTATWSGLERAAAHFLTACRERGEAANTVIRKLSTIRKFAEHHGQSSFLKQYNRPKAGRPQPHPLPGGMADIRKMLVACRTPAEEALVAFCGLAGLRVGEACHVRVKDCDWKARRLTVFYGKGFKTRVVPMSVEFVAYVRPGWLEAKLEQQPYVVALNEDAARKTISRIGERAGISRPVASHDLRATFASAAYRKSKDIRAVQEALGHADPKTTTIYTETLEDDMRAAVELSDELHNPGEEGVA